MEGGGLRGKIKGLRAKGKRGGKNKGLSK